MNRTEEEIKFDEVLASCVPLGRDHVQKEVVGGLGEGSPRYYTVTTIAASSRYGGVRTPIVCSSFEGAKQVVEENMGDIWEHSYMLCVISAFHMDCLYGVPMVKNEDSGEGPLFVPEEYWYKWDLDLERYVPIEAPKEFFVKGPIG